VKKKKYDTDAANDDVNDDDDLTF